MILEDFQCKSLLIYIENPPKSLKIQEKSWKYFLFHFVDIFFWISKKYIFSEKNPYQLKNFPGIQKSYLEHRATSLKLSKSKNPLFCSLFSSFSMIIVHFYVALPLTLCLPAATYVAAAEWIFLHLTDFEQLQFCHY